MTKINLENNYKPIPVKDLTLEYLTISPYYSVAWKYMKRKGVDDPSFADLFDAFHEIAKIDNKINPKEK